MIKPTIDRWRNGAVTPQNIEIIVAIDLTDGPSTHLMNGEGKNYGVKWVVQTTAPFNCVRGWNKGAEQAKGKVIIAVSDDFFPPDRWDHHLLSLEPRNWVDEEYVIRINDNFVKTICTLPIITRKRYEKFGYIFYPRYHSMFCDTELTEKALIDGVLIDAPHLIFEHRHCNNQGRTMDEVDVAHASTERWSSGETIFNQRKAMGFPTDDGPKANLAVEELRLQHERSKNYEGYAAYMQIIKDDFCAYEVCKRIFEEGIRTFFFIIPDEYWSGERNTEDNIAEVKAIANAVTNLGATVKTIIMPVGPFRHPGTNRIAVETLFRNESVAYVQKQGFEHVIILDSDELWKPGLLKKLHAKVIQGRPQAIACRMVPVIGLPGYPVGEAQDKVTIYVRADVRFYHCRSPQCDTIHIDDYDVIHFTACRKTMQEIIDKHRNSGHADDPDYDMEGWIANTLPNARPGLTNAHMYKKFQIWPYVRNWSIEEVQAIPASLHQYCGISIAPPTPPASSQFKRPLEQILPKLKAAPSQKVCQMSAATSPVVRTMAGR